MPGGSLSEDDLILRVNHPAGTNPSCPLSLWRVVLDSHAHHRAFRFSHANPPHQSVVFISSKSVRGLIMRFNPYKFFLIIVAFHLLFLTACRHHDKDKITPEAVKGVLDLSGWDFNRDGPVRLSGEYEFYWKKHLKPSEFLKSTPPQKTGFIRVPKHWNGYKVQGERLSGDGYATYRLKILLRKRREDLALKFLSMGTAFTVYLNGKRVGSIGKAGKNAETTVPQYFPQVIDFGIETNQMELIFLVSNFHHRRGGVWEAVQLGIEKEIRKIRERRLGLDLFLFGSIFIMALHYLGLFILRKKDRSSLYFGIFCFLIVIRLLTTGERSLINIFPNIGWELMIKLEYLSYYLAVPFFALFMRSLFRRFSKTVLHFLVILGFGFSCIVLFTQARTFSYTLPVYEGITLITFVYALWVLIVSSFRKEEGANIFLIGFVILSLTVINDIMYNEKIILTGFLAPFGFFIFILSQAFLHSLRFSKSFKTVAMQHLELRDTLQAYKKETMDRLQAEDALGESEEKYRTILQSIEDGYYEVDLAGNLTFFNDSLCEILGYPRLELMGMNNRQYMSEETAKQTYQTFNEVYRTGKSAKAFGWETIRKDGKTRYLEISVTLIRDAEGRPVGFRGIARDITERKRDQEQTQLHQQQLMQAEKMVALGTLVSGVAHEINNPNNFVLLNTPILKEAWENAVPILEDYYNENGDFVLGGMKYTEIRGNIPKLFSGMFDGATRIKQIVEDLKNYVRKDTAALTQPVDINAVIKSAVSLISNMINKSTKNFSVEYGKYLPVFKGNSQQIEQVIINLIQNACQALPDTEKRIHISTSSNYENGTVVIRIEDGGIGINSDILPHITDPFFTTKQDSGGTGLGLSISLRIIEEHGGTLTFTSTPGIGTTVEIILPVNGPNKTMKGMK